LQYYIYVVNEPFLLVHGITLMI